MKSLRTSAIVFCGSALALCLALPPVTRAQEQPKPATDTFGDKPSPDNTIQPTADHPTAKSPGDQTPAASPAKPDTSSPAPQPDSNNRVSAASNAASAEIHVAGKDAEDRTDRKLAGGKVEGNDGKDLGNINDFLVDPASGRVEYAVISSGGLAGIADKLRVVPLSELKPGDKPNDFRLAIDKDGWDRIAAMPDDAFKAEKITFTDAERRQITGHFGARGSATAEASPYTAGLTSHLVRASNFHRKEVRAGGRDVGTIEALVLDLGKGTATALFDAKRDFAGTSQKYLVPLQQFAFSSAKEAAVTNLTRDDLNRAAGIQISSSSTGTFPVATTSSTERSSSTQTSVAQASTASTAPTASDTTVSRASSSTAPSPGTTTSDQALSMTGRDSTQTAQAATGAKTDQGNTAQTSTAADRSSSTLATTDQSSTARSTNNPNATTEKQTATSDQAVAANNNTPTTSDKGAIASTQTDAQSVTRTPANRNEQGQDIATTVPASPSSKAPGADLAANSTSNAATNQATSADATQKSTTPSSTSVAASSTPSRSATGDQAVSPDAKEPTLTPTGQTSADQVPANADPALVGAALAVRKALDENPALARLDVSVLPENGKLTLRGSVSTNQLKTSVEQAAERAASGKEIDSQLTVETK